MLFYEMNAVELRQALIEDFKIHHVPMVASSPGIGKSGIIRGIAKEFKLKVIDLRVSQCESVDMQGFPGTTPEQRSTFLPPEYFPLEHDEVPEGYEGWLLFLDEFNSGDQSTEAAAYKLLLDREVYKFKLHPRCVIAAAGNLATDRAIVNTPSTATTSRLTHYRLVSDPKVWIDWANANGIDHRVISFIKYKDTLLHKFDPDTDELTFPCPRTWEFASQAIKPFPNEISPLTKKRLAGKIGEGAAVEFATFCDVYLELPQIEDILKNPKSGWKVPTEQSRQLAVTTLLSHNTSAQTIEKIVPAIRRLPVEFQVITFKDIYKRTPELKNHALIKEWIAENASVMF